MVEIGQLEPEGPANGRPPISGLSNGSGFASRGRLGFGV